MLMDPSKNSLINKQTNNEQINFKKKKEIGLAY